MTHGSIITTIDIGSSKVCCCIARRLNSDSYDILGVGCCACDGVKYGVIVDMNAVEKSIAKAVEDAEKIAQLRVKTVFVSISGKNVCSKIVSMSINIGGRIINHEDLMYLFSAFKKDNGDREVIHLVPILYSVDTLNCIKDPIGMICNKLSVNMNVVTVPKTQMHNLFLCLSRCHLDVSGIIHAGYAAGLHVMDEVDRSVNKIVVDIGGDITTISFFYGGTFCGSEIVRLGGKSVTNDIAYGLNISIANAERLKTLHGAAFCSISDEHDMIFVPVIEDDDVINLQRIPKSCLNQLIQPRVEEILLAIKQKIDASAFGGDFSKSILLTGGGSNLVGIRDYATTLLCKKIRFKDIHDYVDGSDVQIDQNFSVALGMIDFVQIRDRKCTRSESHNIKENIFKKTLTWIEKYL